LPATTAPPPSSAALVGDLALLVPLAGLIDPASELQRLSKRLQKLDQELTKTREKLANDNFVRNAPADVVAQEQQRLSDFGRARAALGRQIEQVQALGDA
jgi:valyl-tRNA synthetase